MQVSLGGVCVMRRCLVVSGLVMPGGFAMVPRRVLMVFGCLMMMEHRMLRRASLRTGQGIVNAQILGG